MLSAARIFLVVATLSPTLAFPTEPNGPLDPIPLVQSQTSPAHSASGPFIYLRDRIIQAIWGPPRPIDSHALCRGICPSGSTPRAFRIRYDGDVVLRFKISSDEEAKALAGVADMLYLDIWEATDQWVDIRMAKDIVPSVLGLLPASLRKSHKPLMHDLARTVYESSNSAIGHDNSQFRGFTPAIGDPSTRQDENRELFFRDYQPLSVIYPWMRLMASLFPSHVQYLTIGSSYEGRVIPALRVGVHPTNLDNPPPPRKTILIPGGSHAREWISTSSVNYVAYSLITRYGKFPAITKMLEEFDFVFIPTLNPDGYEYSWSTDRLWRKNRQDTNLQFCHGVDLDRAFGFAWDGEFARSNPCSESYAGDVPFQGVEARRLADWAENETQKNNVQFVAFLDLHSYSQQILYPYSYSCQEQPPSLEDLQEVAMRIGKAFRLTNGHYYGTGPACEVSITAEQSRRKTQTTRDLGGGSALDWFYHELGVKFSFQIKLRDTGSYGFLLPKAHIVPTGQETFNAILAIGNYLMGDRGIELDWGSEFIVSSGNKEESTNSEEIGSAVVRQGSEPATSPEEGADEDWALELRKRRRKR